MKKCRIIEHQARGCYQRFVALRDAIDEGQASWDELTDFFTEDGVYIDPAWGRQEGGEVSASFLMRPWLA
jgi:hypothetical protein